MNALTDYLGSWFGQKPAQPQAQAPQWPTVGQPGGNINYGVQPTQQQSAPQTRNDAFARSHGFKDAATMAAYWQRQQERTAPPPAQSGSMMQQLFAIHPKVLLEHVLDKWNQADGTTK